MAGAWQELHTWSEGEAVKNLRNQGNFYPSFSDIHAEQRRLEAGWNIHHVNTAYQVATPWRTARERPASQSAGATPSDTSLFSPPWATTQRREGIRPVYRFRVRLDITPPAGGGPTASLWVSVEHTGQLTSIQDLLMGGTMQGIIDRYLMGGGPLNLAENQIAIGDYELEVA